MDITSYNVLFGTHWGDDVVLQVVVVAKDKLPSDIMVELISVGEKVENKTYSDLFKAIQDFTDIIRAKIASEDVNVYTSILSEDGCDVYVEWTQGDNGGDE